MNSNKGAARRLIDLHQSGKIKRVLCDDEKGVHLQHDKAYRSYMSQNVGFAVPKTYIIDHRTAKAHLKQLDFSEQRSVHITFPVLPEILTELATILSNSDRFSLFVILKHSVNDCKALVQFSRLVGDRKINVLHLDIAESKEPTSLDWMKHLGAPVRTLWIKNNKKNDFRFSNYPCLEHVENLDLWDGGEEHVKLLQFCKRLQRLHLTRMRTSSMHFLADLDCVPKVELGGWLNPNFSGIERFKIQDLWMSEMYGQIHNFEMVGQMEHLKKLSLCRITALVELPPFRNGLKFLSLTELRALRSIDSLKQVPSLKQILEFGCSKLSADRLVFLKDHLGLAMVCFRGDRINKKLAALFPPHIQVGLPYGFDQEAFLDRFKLTIV